MIYSHEKKRKTKRLTRELVFIFVHYLGRQKKVCGVYSKCHQDVNASTSNRTEEEEEGA